MSEDRLPSIDKLHVSKWFIWKMSVTYSLKAWKVWKLCLRTVPLLQQATFVRCGGCGSAWSDSEAMMWSLQWIVAAWSKMTVEAREVRWAVDALVGQFEWPLSLLESCVLRVENRRTVRNFGDCLSGLMSQCKMDSTMMGQCQLPAPGLFPAGVLRPLIREDSMSQRHLVLWTEGQLVLSCIAQRKTCGASRKRYDQDELGFLEQPIP